LSNPGRLGICRTGQIGNRPRTAGLNPAALGLGCCFMGVDLLDIGFRIEKKFHVSVSKDDLVGLLRDNDVTAGDLYELILTKLHLQDVGRHDLGLNFRLWSEMQSTLQSVTAAPREQIELNSPLETLFPRGTRREMWDELRRACPYRIAELDYPHVVRYVALIVTAAVVLIEAQRVWKIPGVNWFWPLLGLLGCWAFGETYLKILSICAPLRTRLPRGMKTVKDLCRAVLAANYEAICQGTDVTINQPSLAAWEQLVEILAFVLAVDPDTITFRSRLVRDLGMS
jgi:hypothetical protein